MHVGSLQLLDLPQGYAGDFYGDVNCANIFHDGIFDGIGFSTSEKHQ